MINLFHDAVILVNPLGSKCEFREYARELGLAVISVYSVAKSDLAERMGQDISSLMEMDDYSIFSSNLKRVRQELNELPLKYKALIPAHECGVEFAAELAQSLELIHNAPEDMLTARNKHLMRERVANAKLTSPSFAKVSSINEIDEFLANNPPKVVVKTPLGGGTSNVYVCETREDVIKGFEKIKQTKDLFGNFSSFAVLESYLDGTEMIVDGFVDNGEVTIVGVWSYDKIDNEHAHNLYYNIWSEDIEAPESQEIIEYTKNVARAIGIRYGMFHCELKWLNGKPAMIEIGSRLPGWGIPELYRTATNFDPWQSTLEVFTNGKLETPIELETQKHKAMALCPVDVVGRIEKIHGLDVITNLPSYDRHILKINVGDWISPTSELYDTPIEVCLAHEDKEQLKRDVQTAHSVFKVSVKQTTAA